MLEAYSLIKSMASSWQHTRTFLSWYSVRAWQGDGATIKWSLLNGRSRIDVSDFVIVAEV